MGVWTFITLFDLAHNLTKRQKQVISGILAKYEIISLFFIADLLPIVMSILSRQSNLNNLSISYLLNDIFKNGTFIF